MLASLCSRSMDRKVGGEPTASAGWKMCKTRTESPPLNLAPHADPHLDPYMNETATKSLNVLRALSDFHQAKYRKILLKCKPAAGGEGCWEWPGAVTATGYGKCEIEHTTITIHRLSFFLMKGDIPTGLFVCHTCDNRLCVNPEHLFLGTNTDNMRDMCRKGRQVMQGIKYTHCRRGHEYTPENTCISRGWKHCRKCQALADAGLLTDSSKTAALFTFRCPTCLSDKLIKGTKMVNGQRVCSSCYEAVAQQ